MTFRGIPMWMPFSDEDVSLFDMETGSRTEAVVAVALLAFACVFGWELLPEGVKDTHRLLIEATEYA